MLEGLHITRNHFVKHKSSSMPTMQCKPIQRIVFVKTHKTASTTTASIFERYGYYRNLTFVLGRSHIISTTSTFSRKMALKFPGIKNQTFDILCNHVRYDRKEMDFVVPDATYITVLRKPEDQLESAFGYFVMSKGMNLKKEANPFKTFVNDPKKYYGEKKYYFWFQSRNGQLFDLGLEHKYDENITKIQEVIEQLDKDFDLILLSEYYDESLILLKRLLCWEFEDILYISKGMRKDSRKFEKDDLIIEKARNWNYGDFLLYDHFNKTFWKKVAEYGSSFWTDLAKFRKLNREVFETCVDQSKRNERDWREVKYLLSNSTERCVGIIQDDVQYIRLIRSAMEERFGETFR